MITRFFLFLFCIFLSFLTVHSSQITDYLSLPSPVNHSRFTVNGVFAAPVHSSQLTVNNKVHVSAFIGENCVTIFGYSSPGSRIELSSSRVFATTLSDQNGYFEFSQTILPKNPSDLCLRAVDADTRSSNPVCIPPPPADNYLTTIGPIILPPTITIDTDTIKSGQTLIASGQSIPNSVVSVHLYQKDSQPLLLPKPANAFVLPQLTVKTDSEGNYNLNLPTTYSTNYRLLASVTYQDQNSPLSNTVFYQLPSLWYLFWLKYSFYIIAIPLFFATLILLFVLLSLRHQPLNPPAPPSIPWACHNLRSKLPA